MVAKKILKCWIKRVDRKGAVGWETKDGEKYVFCEKELSGRRKGKWKCSLDDKEKEYSKTKPQALKFAKSYMKKHDVCS